MFSDLDTFFVSLYYTVDSLFQRFFSYLPPVSPLHPSHSEVVSLFLLFQWSPYSSERSMFRYALSHWKQFFPTMLERSAFNRRVRKLSTFICALVPLIEKIFMEFSDFRSLYQTLDGIICPAIRCCRARKSPLVDPGMEFGRGGSEKRFHYGFKILTVTNSYGMITGFLISPANTEERVLAECLFRFRQNPLAEAPTSQELDQLVGKTGKLGRKSIRAGLTGSVVMSGVGFPTKNIYIGDSGFTGKNWKEHWRNIYNITIITKDDFLAKSSFENERSKKITNGIRQIVETVHSHLTDEFKLWYPNAKTYAGFVARIGAKYAIQNLCMGLNLPIGGKIFELRKYNPLLG
jgi:hypothetical protein